MPNSRDYETSPCHSGAATEKTLKKIHGPEAKLIPYDEEKHADIISINESENELVSEGQKEYLQRALERLPLEFGEVIVLYELECLSNKELAAALGIPVDTVMSRLSRARRRVQEGSEYGLRAWIVARPSAC
jgi:RNA polymerase sigma factor (sigma-70 family)